jgi:hypothetical protein
MQYLASEDSATMRKIGVNVVALVAVACALIVVAMLVT